MEGAPKLISSHLSLGGPSFLDIQSPKVWENPSITGFLFSKFQNQGLWDLWPGGHPAHQPTLCLQHKTSWLTVSRPLATPSTTWACPVPGSESRDSQEHMADPTPPPAPPRHPAHWPPATGPPLTSQTQPLHGPLPLLGARGPGWPLGSSSGGLHCSPSLPDLFTTNRPSALPRVLWLQVTRGAGRQLSILSLLCSQRWAGGRNSGH